MGIRLAVGRNSGRNVGPGTPVDYPLYRESNYWLHDVERLLAHLGDDIHTSVPFDFAVIGEEVSGSTSAHGGGETRAITRDALEEEGSYLLSTALWQQMLPNTRAEH